MWIEPGALSAAQARYTDSLGRALMLAQNFEHNCKFVFGIHDLGRAFADGTRPIETWQEYGKKLQERSLGAALKAQQGSLSAEQIALLEAAREERNYIAHDAGEPGQYVPPISGKPGGSKKLRAMLSREIGRAAIEAERAEILAATLREGVHRLRDAVLALAKADSMVAKWSYVSEGKDDQLPAFSRRYASEVAEWVLEPLRIAGLVDQSGGAAP